MLLILLSLITDSCYPIVFRGPSRRGQTAVMSLDFVHCRGSSSASLKNVQRARGRTGGTARGPEQGETAALRPREPFPPLLAPGFPPGPSLGSLEIHPTSLNKALLFRSSRPLAVPPGPSIPQEEPDSAQSAKD